MANLFILGHETENLGAHGLGTQSSPLDDNLPQTVRLIPNCPSLCWSLTSQTVCHSPAHPLHSVLGPVISLLQFQSAMEVTTKAVISPNNTQCVNLDIQDTHFQVNEVNIQLIETYVKPAFFLLDQCRRVPEGPSYCLRGDWSTIVH